MNQMLIREIEICIEQLKKARDASLLDAILNDLSNKMFDLISIFQEEYKNSEGEIKNKLKFKIEKNIVKFNDYREQTKNYGRNLRLNFNGRFFNAFHLPKIDFGFSDCRGATFLGANLEEVIFNGANCEDADFNSSRCNNASFMMAKCNGATFLHSNLNDAHFPSAHFNSVDLTGAQCENTDFGECFMEGVRLWNTNLKNSNLEWASLRNARFYSTTKIDGIRLKRCCFDGSTIVAVKDELLEEVFNTEKENIDGNDVEMTNETLSGIYANLKRYFFSEHDYEASGHFFIKERETVRKNLFENMPSWTDFKKNADEPFGRYVRIKMWTHPRAAWIFESFLYHVGRYGQKLFDVFAFALSLILIFGSAYSISDYFYETVADVTHGKWSSIFEYFYFSLVTFTTLGFGDIHPAHWTTQIMASAEAASGAFLMAYFVVMWARKIQP